MTLFTRCSICRCLIEKDTYVFYCMCSFSFPFSCAFILYSTTPSSHHNQPSQPASQPSIASFVIISHTYFHSFVNAALLLAHSFSAHFSHIIFLRFFLYRSVSNIHCVCVDTLRFIFRTCVIWTWRLVMKSAYFDEYFATAFWPKLNCDHYGERGKT